MRYAKPRFDFLEECCYARGVRNVCSLHDNGDIFRYPCNVFSSELEGLLCTASKNDACSTSLSPRSRYSLYDQY